MYSGPYTYRRVFSLGPRVPDPGLHSGPKYILYEYMAPNALASVEWVGVFTKIHFRASPVSNVP